MQDTSADSTPRIWDISVTDSSAQDSSYILCGIKQWCITQSHGRTELGSAITLSEEIHSLYAGTDSNRSSMRVGCQLHTVCFEARLPFKRVVNGCTVMLQTPELYHTVRNTDVCESSSEVIS